MIIHALLLTLGVLAAPAHADLSDSGNLTIGGNGALAGALTASSVTLTATGSGIYALTSSSGLHVLGGSVRLEPGAYIRWPDNTTSTTAATGTGAGDMILASTQNVSGAKVFLSSVTAGPTIYTTTATTSGAAVTANGSALVNTWMIVASTNPSGSQLVQFTGLVPGKQYMLIASYRINVATSSLYYRFNSDSGSNYKYGVSAARTDSGAFISNVSENASYCPAPAFTSCSPGYDCRTIIEFGTNTAGAKGVGAFSRHVTPSGAHLDNSYGACYYNGSLALSSITVQVNIADASATFSGFVYLMQLVPGV